MKSSHTTIKERRDTLLDLLQGKTSLQVKEISQLLDVSEITVRRDLTALEKMYWLNEPMEKRRSFKKLVLKIITKRLKF
ncbi:DeoR family transcriptional regulator [Enterococcus termitis]